MLTDYALQSPALEYNNTKGYDQSFKVVGDTIKEALQEYRTADDNVGPHVQAREFDEIRYAATRADVIGHSMGGQMIRTYVSNLGNNGSNEVVEREGDWHNASFARGEEDDYLRDSNWGAGDVRRFIAIGSPFRGSDWANVAAPILRPPDGTKSRNKELIRMKILFLAHAPALARELWDDWGDLRNTGDYITPTAIMDLAVGSDVQHTLEAYGRYPTGRRSVYWYPLVGIATESIQEAPVQGVLFELLLTRVKFAAGVWPWEISTLSPANSDLIVNQWSQRNSPDGSDPHARAGTPSWQFHLHTFGNQLYGAIQQETFSLPMSAGMNLTGNRKSIAELLSRSRAEFLKDGLGG